jgi:CBS domain-containing protein
MGAIYDLVRNNQVLTVTENDSVSEAARIMSEHNIGAVPVLNDGELVGVFSERDIMKRVVAEGLDPRKIRVSEVMSTGVWAVGPDEPVESCMVLMKMHGVRHLPILERNRLLGVVSLRDILLHEVTEMDGEVRAMRAYIQSGT